MTNERADALAQIAALPPDRAFQREWLDRGGHYQVFEGDPVKQAKLLRELPVKYVVTARTEREW